MPKAGVLKAVVEGVGVAWLSFEVGVRAYRFFVVTVLTVVLVFL